MTDDHETSKCDQEKNLKAFIRTHGQTFNRHRHRRDGYSSNSSVDGGKYRRKYRTKSPFFKNIQPSWWLSTNQPKRYESGRISKWLTTLPWNKKRWTSLTPTKGGVRKNNYERYHGGYPQCIAPPYKPYRNEKSPNRGFGYLKDSAT